MEPTATVYVCRAPGIPCNYKGELLGLLFRSHFSPHNLVTRVDCQGAITAVLSERRSMKEAYWVLAVRNSISASNQSVVCPCWLLKGWFLRSKFEFRSELFVLDQTFQLDGYFWFR